ncbi:hypothetical protein C6497_06620 [Candidatus Poribacteria bacterium]|nr:MAG: hypothetical protein C6497_06620 [Candidatus Poribacteria bacterium]
MFKPEFSYTHTIVKNLMDIEGAKEVIKNSPILPIWESRLQKDALIRQAHHTTRIEGTQLTIEQVRDLIDDKPVVARKRDIQEVRNYLKVAAFIDEVYADPDMELDLRTIRHIHYLILDGIEGGYEPGEFRKIQNYVVDNKTKEVIYTPPPASEVPILMLELVDWLRSNEASELSPLLKAGIAHYQLVTIHPFLDGNGRTARALANLILYHSGYDIKKLFSLEEHYDMNPADYYEALQSVRATGILTTWLEYFTVGIAAEMQKIKELVLTHSRDRALRDKIGQIALSERQLTILTYVEKHGRITNRELQQLADLSHTSAHKELLTLVQNGLLNKKGEGRGTYYVRVDDF